MSTTVVETSKECRWCGMIHGTFCPFVKAIEYFADGTVKKVEFKDYSVPATVPYPVPYPVPAPVYPHPGTPPPLIPWRGNTCSAVGMEIIPSNWSQ